MLDWIEAAAEAFSETVNGTLLPIAEFLEKYVWWWPEEPYVPLLAMVLLGAGLLAVAGFVPGILAMAAVLGVILVIVVLRMPGGD